MDLEALALRRAEEQMRRIDMHEPVKHDGWAIKPTQYQGRKPAARRPCLAGECGRRGDKHGYCHLHYMRIRKGEPYDSHLYRITDAERRRLSTGKRFGGGIDLGGRG